jgi:hypothetical protein
MVQKPHPKKDASNINDIGTIPGGQARRLRNGGAACLILGRRGSAFVKGEIEVD